MNDYLDGEVTDELRLSLEAHLAKCPNCWVIFDEAEKTIRIFRNYPCSELPDDVHDRLLRAIETRWKRS